MNDTNPTTQTVQENQKPTPASAFLNLIKNRECVYDDSKGSLTIPLKKGDESDLMHVAFIITSAMSRNRNEASFNLDDYNVAKDQFKVNRKRLDYIIAAAGNNADQIRSALEGSRQR
jgi:hypothetical protein